ncbi:hypothetical protein CC117_09740 [Parafrankia colletiae]|uniref:Uncharacterized protein n=1 Tax=Parafrankia colletiae TaxID=573497 RepID=A0A1S1RJL1_9ACTN|nr:hypothetical protein [Parafrankia colletiae]MCK9903176.1 hypothetical protein [Frankia sp. Cpl3]OHV44974.1 hypothetical protein CC117_09740 [Parafrankia colletiae]
MDVEQTVFGLVRFDGDSQRVREIVVAFESAAAADRFAREIGWSEYSVGPVCFPAMMRVFGSCAAVA